MNQHAKKKVLIITSNFFPEETGISVYSTDLVLKVLSSKYDVCTVTTLPHYPWWEIPDRFKQIPLGKSKVNNFELLRLKHHIPKKGNAIGRALMEFTFWIGGMRISRLLEKEKFELVIAIMPLVSAGLIARRISRKLKINGLVIFQDVTSQGALQSGLPGSRTLYGLAKFLESRASKWSSKIVVVSEAMIPPVTKLTGGRIPVEVIHNYSLISSESIIQEDARKHLGIIGNQFLVLHSGNMGYKQDLINVVEAAKLLRENKEIKFLLVGHGNQEDKLKAEIQNLENIEIRPLVDVKDFPFLLSSADVLLLNESPKLREMSLPSKLTSYLSSGRPVLAAVSSSSATSNFLSDSAYIIKPGNPNALVEAILCLKGNPALQKQLAQRGSEFSQTHLSPQAGRSKLLKVVSELLP